MTIDLEQIDATRLTSLAQVGNNATNSGKHTGKTRKHATDCVRWVKLHYQDNHLQQKKAAEKSLPLARPAQLCNDRQSCWQL